MIEIKPVLVNYWFGYTFDNKTAYSSIKGAKMAALSFGIKIQPDVAEIPPLMLKRMIRYVMYYDIIYREPGADIEILKLLLGIPSKMPARLEDKDWDHLYYSIKRQVPRHELFRIVETQESDALRFREKGLI